MSAIFVNSIISVFRLYIFICYNKTYQCIIFVDKGNMFFKISVQIIIHILFILIYYYKILSFFIILYKRN